jgi:P4 family phage/plasmid primase-like protien
MNASTFLQEVFSGCESGTLEFRLLSTKKEEKPKNIFWPLDKLPSLPLLDLNRNCYFGCATRNGGGTKEHIVEIPCVWTDNDFKLLPRAAIDKLLAECPFPPSIQEFTGGGYQCFWLLKEPARKQEVPVIESLLRRLAAYFNADPAACDASRILRVPGTFNLKPEYQRPKVEILSMDTSRRYDLSDFDQWLPEDPKQRTATGEARNPEGWQNEALKGVSEGSRHKTALSLAGRYFQKGLDPREVRTILFQWNQGNNPPLEERELERIFVDVQSMHLKEGQAESEQKEQTPLSGYTDLQNAVHFAEKHKGKIRFCHRFNKWLHWTGTRWDMDETGDIWRTAKQHTLSMIGMAGAIQDDKERAAFLKEMAKLQNEKKLTAMVNLARHMEGIPVAPAELDSDMMLFNCESGTVDLRTFDYLRHDPKHLITKISPFPIADTSDCPKWRAHLDLIMGGNKELVAFVQRAFGSCLSGENIERKLFIPEGEGANGKSLTLETLEMVLGDYALKTTADSLLVKRYEGIPNDIARLNGSRFVYSSETQDGKRLAESLVKELSGDRFITARFMRGEFFQFPITFKIWLATNHLPTIRGTDPAIWDRVLVIPFHVRIPEDQRRPREELLNEFKAEGPGILKWLLLGCADWLSDGLNPPPEVITANLEYRDSMDILRSFVEDECLTGERMTAKSADLYAKYEKWAKDNGEEPLKRTSFGKRLRERGFKDFRDAQGLKAWRGIGLLQKGEG